jgi:glycosyltransferase involved in cell wall biosynthesis
MDLAPDIERAGAGLVVPPRVEETAAAVRRLLEDEPLRRSVGGRGRALVLEKFTWENCANRLNAAFDDILSGRRRSGAWR